MSFFQIYKHCLFIARRLLGEKLANMILPKIECCSEVEEDSSDAYQSRQVPWRSPSYSILLVALDNHTVDYLHEFKGKNRMMKCPEYHKGYNGGQSSQSPCPNLPENFYSKRFLEENSHSQRIALDVQPAWTDLEATVEELTPPDILESHKRQQALQMSVNNFTTSSSYVTYK